MRVFVIGSTGLLGNNPRARARSKGRDYGTTMKD